MLQNSYRVTLRIINIRYQEEYFDSLTFIHAKELGRNDVLIIVNSRFVSNYYEKNLFLLASTNNATVQFTNCQFIKNNI